MKVALDPARLAILNKKFESASQRSKFSDKDKSKFYTMGRNGRYVFRIMPMTADQNNFFGKFVGNHWIKFNDDEKGSYASCVEQYNVQGAVCPICEAFRELENSGIDTTGFWKMKSNIQVALKVLMLEAPNEDTFPMNKISFFKVTAQVFQKMVEIYNSADSPDILDPNTGVAWVVSRGEKEKHWNVKLLDSSMPQCGILGGSIENRDALLEANETTDMEKIFKLPSDEDMMKIKELAKTVKEKIIRAKGAVDNSVNEMAAEAISAEPAPVSLAKQIPIVNPLQQSVPMAQQPVQQVYQPQQMVMPMQQSVYQPASIQQAQPSFMPYQTAMSSIEDDEIPFDVQSPAQTVAKPVQETKQEAAAPTVNIDYDNLTQQQKAIIEQYRDGCKMPCFGHHDKYDELNNHDCLLDPYSSNCALCIKALTGIDHTKDLGIL